MTFLLTSFLALSLGLLDVVLFANTDTNTNVIDCWFAAKFRRFIPFHTTDDQLSFWQPILQTVIMNLSEQQFLTGIAMLTAGLWKHCSISVYHFSLVFDLGWFASVTQLITMSTLATHLRKDKTRRNVRVFLMIVMMALLLTYVVLRSHKDWYMYWTTPAQCLFDDLAGNAIASYISLYFLAILCAYIPTIIFAYEELFELCRNWLVTMPTVVLDKGIETARRRADSRYGLFSCCLYALALLRAVFLGMVGLLSSFCFAYLIIWGWFALGVFSIMAERAIASSRVTGNENALTFGQFVPIFLLGYTVLVFREAYYGENSDRARSIT